MIKTTLHHYCFDTAKTEDAAAWAALKEKLAPMLYLQMHSHSGGNQPITYRNESQEVELDPKCLFDNQWNEAAKGDFKGRRLFDWYLEYRLSAKRIKQGHWLEQTQEMTDIRNNTKKCGYCGNMSTGPEEFCGKCLGSEYLERDNIYLTRMRPVSERPRQFPKLTPEEEAVLSPAYEIAQGLGAEEREKKAHSHLRKKIAALIPEAMAKSIQIIEEAKKKTEALTWLLDHKYRDIDNVIYYSHTGKFSFGWRNKLSKEQVEELNELLVDFPFDWEVSKNA